MQAKYNMHMEENWQKQSTVLICCNNQKLIGENHLCQKSQPVIEKTVSW